MIWILTSLGCGMGMFNANGAIVEDKVGNYRTLAVTAERRVIMFNDVKNRYCAEPPPDVAQNISSALSFGAKATAGKLPADVEAEYTKALAVAAQRLMNRSQGLQLYRDGMYYLCQAFINEGVPVNEFMAQSASLLRTAEELIKHEITVSNGRINMAPADSTAPLLPETPAAGAAGSRVRPQ
ncbi:MAG: hypothetical protein IPP12_13995 [Nitrospira sp.]|nr:hypothetical protein [Nitrospira sp.]